MYSEVPQSSVLGHNFYLCINDIPSTSNSKIATFANFIALIVTGTSIEDSTTNLQQAIDAIAAWTRISKKQNVHQFHQPKIFSVYTPKYLEMELDAKLWWKAHVKKKQEALEIKF